VGGTQVFRFFPGPRTNGLRAERLPNTSKGFALREMVPSPYAEAGHGDPQSFRLRSRGQREVGAGGGT
jgi:hypothetical protein